MNRPFEMDRRALVQRILLLAGAAVIPIGCDGLSASPGGNDFSFKADQFAALSAIADTIVPKGASVGALDAEVPKKFEDLMRDWASEETRGKLIGAIDGIDKAATTSSGRRFADLGPDARLELLNAHDAAALKTRTLSKEEQEARSIMDGPAYVDPGYAKLRELIILLFYYSEPALTQELTYVHTPGRWDPSVPITPETRPSGGLGLF